MIFFMMRRMSRQPARRYGKGNRNHNVASWSFGMIMWAVILITFAASLPFILMGH